MDMGFHDMRNAHVVLFGDLQVSIDIAFGVDHGGYAGLLASDEIAGLGQGLVVDVLEKHGQCILWCKMCLPSCMQNCAFILASCVINITFHSRGRFVLQHMF